MHQVGPFWRLLAVLGCLSGVSWLPRAAKMVLRGPNGGSKNGYLVDFGWILLQILHIFIDKYLGMSVSWAPFGRILVSKKWQNGLQETSWRFQEWIFARFLDKLKFEIRTLISVRTACVV